MIIVDRGENNGGIEEDKRQYVNLTTFSRYLRIVGGKRYRSWGSYLLHFSSEGKESKIVVGRIHHQQEDIHLVDIGPRPRLHGRKGGRWLGGYWGLLVG